ncbi:MAG TPA: nicotinate (nicotinamide) nucleotide adenylyltransferase [Bacteroidia bacterium]|nr:nicotinate (nicotinamide) nucleotide adenylyltransferase [Bacteroidia bacterium]
MKKTGLFFGSFNPIHIGHLALANYMVSFTDLDEVWFVVSPHNPLKEKQSLLAQNHRLYMVKLATENYPKFKASDIEFKLSQPSYTINTLAHLKEKYPKKNFSLIMGMDNLQNFNKWKNYEQILEKHSIYVYPRQQSHAGDFINHPNIKITEAPVMEISSSFIRKAILDKKDVTCFMPEKVAAYVDEMNFYRK